jgi:hypothetical protein
MNLRIELPMTTTKDRRFVAQAALRKAFVKAAYAGGRKVGAFTAAMYAADKVNPACPVTIEEAKALGTVAGKAWAKRGLYGGRI